MGLPSFVKVLKYGCLAIFGLAAALAAITVLSTPAAADQNGGGGDVSLKPWDTDNLAYGSYSARNFRVPFHEYGGYASFSFPDSSVFQSRAREACQSAVADGFFQTGGSVGAKNDFPVLDKTGSTWTDSATGSRSSGCGDFVAQQHLAAERANDVGGGFYLDIAGNLRSGLNGRPLRNYSLRTRSYTHWTNSRSNRIYGHSFTRTSGQDSSIPQAARQYGTQAYSASRVITRSPRSGYAGLASAGGFAGVDPYLARTDNYRSRVSHVQPSGGNWLPAGAVLDARNEYMVPSTSSTYQGRNYYWGVAHLSSDIGPRFLSHIYDIGSDTSSTAFCPAGMHPRGQDGSHVIGRSTGRTLSSINKMDEVEQADRHWCRSDIRYKIAFKGQIHNKCDSNGRNPSSTGTSECLPPSGVGDPRDGTFQAFGRINCYYTVIELSVATDGTARCVYPHPLPQCTDNGTKRNFSQTELQAHTIGETFTPADDGSTDCAAAPAATPAAAPSQADFTADACVTASLVIYENRAAGSDAEPGIAASDRTLAVTAGRTAWDLDVTLPHPATASPPRDTGDASGCADGSESRADHSSQPAGAARKQSPAPSYASSGRADTAAPPNDADDDIDYTGAVRNIAHRYAGRVAEHTCSVKRAEARLRIALLEAEAELYKDWMGRYSRWSESRKDAFNGWRPSGYPYGVIDTSPSSYSTFYAFVHAKLSKARLDYARGMRARYAGLQTSTGTVAAASLAKPSVSNSWCGDPSGLVSSYSANVTALKTSAANALRASSVTLAGVDSAPVVTPASSGTSATTAGTAAVYETVRQARTRTVAKRYMNCGLGQVPEDLWDQLPDNHLCTEYSKQETETYYVNVRSVRTSEVKATVEHSYPGYTLSVSGGGWSRSKTIAAATRTQTCGTWETSSCPSAGSHPGHSYADLLGTLPAGTEEYPDKTMVNSNFVRVMNDRQLADTQSAARHALQRLTNRDRWAWLNTGQKIFECETH